MSATSGSFLIGKVPEIYNHVLKAKCREHEAPLEISQMLLIWDTHAWWTNLSALLL